MAKIFITGSSDGLGFLAAKQLISEGHSVLVHGRNEKRAEDTLKRVGPATGAVAGDLGNIEETKLLAAKVNHFGKFDAIIHNAGVYTTSPQTILNVNVLAPYMLTSLILRPERLIYLSSGMHMGGRANGFDKGGISYSDSKLYVLMLAKFAALRWPDVYSNALDPGWVPTKMGGPGAPDNLQKGYETQVWLATSHEQAAKVSGRYFFHKTATRSNPLADDQSLHEKFISDCEKLTGINFPLK